MYCALPGVCGRAKHYIRRHACPSTLTGGSMNKLLCACRRVRHPAGTHARPSGVVAGSRAGACARAGARARNGAAAVHHPA